LAKTLNRVSLLGNVGRAPEIKATGGGTLVAALSLATVNRYKDKNGNWQDATEWHNLIVFGKLAEIIRDYVGKGSKLFAEGRLQTRSWDEKDTGKTRYRTEVIVSDVTLLGAPKGKAATGDENEVPGYAYTRETAVDDGTDFNF